MIAEDKTIEILKKAGQTHIIEYINKNNLSKELVKQVEHLETVYPGGIVEYCNRAKNLLKDSMNNVNPYSDFTPFIPEGININVGDNDFFNYEKIGLENLDKLGFVLVAGGLGERLGYPDIKLSIPIDLITETNYIKYYANHILAFQEYCINILKKDVEIPLCIMTSDDTHEATVKLLRINANYNLKNVEIVKQEKVPALINNDCHIALTKEGLMETKPHGHGDVHTLLYQNKVVERWIKNGKKYLIFFQDTNALAMKTVTSLLGVSIDKQFAVNSMSVPRKPGEAMGAICKLTSKQKSITINVEYNQLDSLLKDKYNPNGDIPNKQGFSDFPGNTNVLCFELTNYLNILNSTKGLIPEFVNPKYKDETKTSFKSATRLECMMQDFPLLFNDNQRVGFTSYPIWFAFSSCKNNLEESIGKYLKGNCPDNAFSAEINYYSFFTKCLEILNKITINDSEKEDVEICGSKIQFGPKIIISPFFAFSLSQLKEKFNGHLTISGKSSLVIKGSAIINKDLKLDGHLTLESKLEEGEYTSKNYIKFESLKENEGQLFEKIRGYRKV